MLEQFRLLKTLQPVIFWTSQKSKTWDNENDWKNWKGGFIAHHFNAPDEYFNTMTCNLIIGRCVEFNSENVESACLIPKFLAEYFQTQ